MSRNLSNTEERNRGFSLVELLVATALFTIVVAVAAGSFLSILEASRESRELNELMLAVDFAMEDMSRSLRTGSEYDITGDDEISFLDEDDERVEYRLSNGAIQKNTPDYSGWLPLTPDEVVITNLVFSQGSSGLYDQPRVTINVVGHIEADPESEFYLQTSVTQRELNFPL